MIIRNLCTNPSFETGTTGWEPWTAGSVIATTSSTLAVAGTRIGASTSQVGGTLQGMMAPAIPVPSYASVISASASMRSTYPIAYGRIRVRFFDAGGIALDVYQYSAGVQLTPSEWRMISIAGVPVPVGAVTLQLVCYLADSAGANLDTPDGTILYVDAVMVAPSAVAQPYGDGDQLGWKWEGIAHASASLGHAQPYKPDAQLLVAGTRVDWLDLVPGFEETVELRNVVQVTNDPAAPPYVTIREGRDGRGTLRMHFVRELGTGDAGDRALAVLESLNTGAPHRLEFHQPFSTDYIAGLGAGITIVPAGQARRIRPEASRQVWTVECDFHRTVA